MEREPPRSPTIHYSFGNATHARFSVFFVASLLWLPHSIAEMVSFEYPNFKDSTGICLQGNVSIEGTGAILAYRYSGGQSIGRAYHCSPIRLWNPITNELADFTTKFSFGISTVRPDFSFLYSVISGGLAFFLAEDPGVPLDGRSDYLGLVNSVTVPASDGSRFVAVEFDSRQNTWDPDDSSSHVGIDVNSIESVAYIAMGDNTFRSGPQGNARIIYNSSTKNLSVSLDFNRTLYELSYIVDLRIHLPQWVYVGFSLTTDFRDPKNITSWMFESSSLESPSESPETLPVRPVDGAKSNPVQSTHRNTSMLIVVIVAPLSVVLLGMFGIATWRFVTKRTEIKGQTVGVTALHRESRAPVEPTPINIHGSLYSNGMYISTETGTISCMHDHKEASPNEEFTNEGPQRIPFEHLVAATENFHENRKLGRGGFGAVYHGFLKNLNQEAAIKRIAKDSKQGLKEFVAEVNTISQLRHRNLVQLLGWCHEGRELLIAYEFLSNRSLDYHLFDDTKVLTWPQRFHIALGVASALRYLHEGCAKCIVHRDIKPSNIMLDRDFNGKLGDFGLARIANHGSALQSTLMAGTIGYMAPEYFITGRSSKETDVYSFGIVAMEIACGRSFMEPPENGEETMIDWLWKLYKIGTLTDAADKKLQMAFDKREMERLMLVGLWCSLPQFHSRPAFRQVVAALNFQVAVPDLDLRPLNVAPLPLKLSLGPSDSTPTSSR